ncbi:MAG: sugar ABC transporter permease, partial [Firmicutes bacterium]|nr:sugar ABC transporter permease [Bacillota bacterium]
MILSPAMLIVFGVIIAPLISTFIYSLKNMELISPHKGEFVWFANYAEILGSPEFWDSLWRTVYFTFVSLTLETMLGLLVALLLNSGFKGEGFVRAIIILPWAVPTIVSGAMWKWIYDPQYGILNAILTGLGLIPAYRSWLGTPLSAMNMIIIADVWKMTPLAVIFFL